MKFYFKRPPSSSLKVGMVDSRLCGNGKIKRWLDPPLPSLRGVYDTEIQSKVSIHTVSTTIIHKTNRNIKLDCHVRSIDLPRGDEPKGVIPTSSLCHLWPLFCHPREKRWGPATSICHCERIAGNPVKSINR